MKMVSRRSFLKMAGVSALAIAGVSALAACSGGGTIPSGPSDLSVTLRIVTPSLIGDDYAKSLNEAQLKVAYTTDEEELVKRILSAIQNEASKNEALKNLDAATCMVLGHPTLDSETLDGKETKVLKVKLTRTMG